MHCPSFRCSIRVAIVMVLVFYSVFGIYLWLKTFSEHKTTAAEPKVYRVMPIVIVGYMRSGSTLTGDILQQDPRVFYVFEPLYDMQTNYIATMEEQFPDFRFKSMRSSVSLKENYMSLHRAWFTCDFQYIISNKLRFHINFFKYGKKTNELLKCLIRQSAKNMNRSKECTLLLRQHCLTSSVILIKTIRTPLMWFLEMMEEFPNMKIIHLVRDPRAIINSQKKFGECSAAHGGMVGCTQYLCSLMEDDITAFEIFKRLYPDTIQMVRFEDLATRPIEVSKQMYEFLGLEFSPTVQEFVFNATMAGVKSTGIMSTTRENSTNEVNRWRTSLSDENLKTVQVLCKYVMEQLSYYHFIRTE